MSVGYLRIDRADNTSHVTAVIGAVEELAQSDRTHGITREQFDINFFANVNIIKAALPAMRKAKNGHIMMLTGVSESYPGLRSLLCIFQTQY